MPLKPFAFIEGIEHLAEPFGVHSRVGLGVRALDLGGVAVRVIYDVEVGIAFRPTGVGPPFVGSVGAVVPFGNPHGAPSISVPAQVGYGLGQPVGVLRVPVHVCGHEVKPFGHFIHHKILIIGYEYARETGAVGIIRQRTHESAFQPERPHIIVEFPEFLLRDI